jgi:predicted transcriptional regulator
MASNPQIFGIYQSDLLAAAGTALLQVKNQRGLTLTEMAQVMGRCDDQVARYIAGESEMGFITWERAKDAWPELFDRVNETAAERDLRRRQRVLDLEQPKRSAAA